MFVVRGQRCGRVLVCKPLSDSLCFAQILPKFRDRSPPDA